MCSFGLHCGDFRFALPEATCHGLLVCKSGRAERRTRRLALLEGLTTANTAFKTPRLMSKRRTLTFASGASVAGREQASIGHSCE